MNKKIYMSPALQIVEIHTEKLIAESLGFVDDEISDPNQVGTKDQGDWDDDLWDD